MKFKSREEEISQDSLTESGNLYGDKGQLSLVGFIRKNKIKKYIVKCSICEKDGELFDEGLFLIYRQSLLQGALPCGCSKQPKWTKDQFEILVKRKAFQLGYTFLGFAEKFNGHRTKVSMM